MHFPQVDAKMKYTC